MLIFDKNTLEERLKNLSSEKRMIFALETAQRLAEDENHPDLKEVLIKFKEIVKSQSEEYDQDSLAAFIYAIGALINENNTGNVLSVAEKSYNHADEVAQEQLNIKDFSEESEEKLKSSKAVQNELQAQNDILKQLETE